MTTGRPRHTATGATGADISAAAYEYAWAGFQARYDGGLYDLGDLAIDADAGDPIISRPGEMTAADAEVGAWILRRLGFNARHHYHTTPALGWTIKVRRYA